jgi:hypothetical protein
VSRKKGAAIAVIIAVVAAIGGLAAYSAMPKQEEAGPEPVLTTMDRQNWSDNNEEDSSTTIAENVRPQPQQQQDNGSSIIANNTVIANNTIVINKPVYRNNTIIYQPVTINLENYRTTINQHIELDDANNNGNDNSNNKPAADKSHSITIRAKRIQSEDWSKRFTDDGVGMFTAVYDINGDIVKTGYADERGFTANGLEDKLYFVYPADCNDCGNSKNDIVFKQWEDGSKDRPRLVPADSDVTASYTLVVPEKPKQVPLIPPGETKTAAEPEITLEAHNATYIYGWVQVSVQLENKVEGYDEILLSVYAPDGTLQESFSYPEQQGFFISREAGEGNYRIVATYKYDKGTAKTEIMHPVKFVTPEFVNLSATEDNNNNGAVRVSGLLEGGLAGENITIAVNSPDGQTVKKYAMSFGTKPIFTLFIPSEEAKAIFSKTVNYTFVVTHLPTGVQGSVTLSHSNNGSETEEASAAAPVNVSNNAGRSERAYIAVQESNIYVVWQDDTSGQNEIMFAKSTDSGTTFSDPVAISKSEQGGSSLTPDIAVLGDSVYIVWVDHNSKEQSAVALRSSNDSGKTFGDTLILGGNYTGKNADPHVAIFKDDIYVLWVTGAEEESIGDLMLAHSSDGVKFEAAVVGKNATDPAMASSDSALYLAWRQQLSGNNTTEGGGTNTFASSSDGTNFETSERLHGMTIQAISASADIVYIVGTTTNGTVELARSNDSRASFDDTMDIGNGTSPHVAASGTGVYVVWERDGKILFAASSDRGETFGQAASISDESSWSKVAADDDNNVYVAWTEGSDIIAVAVQ